MALTKTVTLETLAKPAMCGSCGGTSAAMPAGTSVYRIHQTTTEGLDFDYVVKADHMTLHSLQHLIPA